MTKHAQQALTVIARFARGQYRITEKLNVSPTMYASLRKAGMVDENNKITDLGHQTADSLPDAPHGYFTANACPDLRA